MFYETAAAATFIICALTTLMQLILLPVLFKYTGTIKGGTEERMKLFKLIADEGSLIIAEKRQEILRKKRSTTFCSYPKAGPPGPPGDPGEDGEEGDEGSVGLPGKSASEMQGELEQQCIICPQGERGPRGIPGNQGLQGPKGERGFPGIPGSNGQDGEVGLEGPEGYNGTTGIRGPKGFDGKPATGGTGSPGPKGLPGPIGRTGPQGHRGKRNYVYGPPGPDGKKGIKGMDGLPGNVGQKGDRGLVGEPGANALFCPCPFEIELLEFKSLRSAPIAPRNQTASVMFNNSELTTNVDDVDEQKKMTGLSKSIKQSSASIVPVRVNRKTISRLHGQPVPNITQAALDIKDKYIDVKSGSDLTLPAMKTLLGKHTIEDNLTTNRKNEKMTKTTAKIAKYTNETKLTTRRRFKYVTKRPRSVG